MKINYLARFDRSFKKLDLSIQQNIHQTITSFLHHLQQGTRPQGLGMRRLQGSVWEFRVGLLYRILFELSKNSITFVFVGTHDEVRKFLKNL